MSSDKDSMLSTLLESELVPALHERIALIRCAPERLVVLDEGRGGVLERLARHFPGARCLDTLQDCEPRSVDLLVANLTLPWCAEMAEQLLRWRAALRPEGILLVTMLGPDTLLELPVEVLRPLRIDMHNLGDALVQAGFSEPVLDVDYVTLAWRDEKKCLEEMRAAGMLVSGDYDLSLQRDETGRIPLTVEVIYAHAFCPVSQGVPGEVRVPVGKILRRSVAS